MKNDDDMQVWRSRWKMLMRYQGSEKGRLGSSVLDQLFVLCNIRIDVGIKGPSHGAWLLWTLTQAMIFRGGESKDARDAVATRPDRSCTPGPASRTSTSQ